MSLFLDVGQFQTVVLFTIFELEPESQQESQYAETGENQHRNRVVVAYVFTGFDRFAHAGIDLVENPADDYREGHQSEVLNPENRRIG